MRAKWLRRFGLGLVLVAAWVVHTYHVGVAPPPPADRLAAELKGQPGGHWIDRAELGIHQLMLKGSPYQRGLDAGRLTAPLIARQEAELVTQLHGFFPNPLLIRGLSLFAMRWFWGIDRYFEPWMLDEMYGVSRWASHDYDDLADPFTRQLAYHGLHEVGQLMVDQGGEDMGCTVAAIPYGGTWVLGRNFDFEGGRIFDTEKVMKWVFPDQGHALVSVIWAGMVGGVTGVNDQGLYLSINAAGSTDFHRQGTPSTLVLLKALQFAANAREALDIIRNARMFITDIFVLLDSKAGELYRIEKSPERTEVLRLEGPSIVTNHLVSDAWKSDRINTYRRDELTSIPRLERGEARLRELPPAASSREASAQVLSILRDKGEKDGRPLPLGNRRAIDALIATHSVVFDPLATTLYVSQGPGVSGAFLGFDLKRSFEQGRPMRTGDLPRDPRVSDELFGKIRNAARIVSAAEKALARQDCEQAAKKLRVAAKLYTDDTEYHLAQGDFEARCRKDPAAARAEWLRAEALVPAYPREARALKSRLEGKT